jgi:hypothetical protein
MFMLGMVMFCGGAPGAFGGGLAACPAFAGLAVGGAGALVPAGLLAPLALALALALVLALALALALALLTLGLPSGLAPAPTPLFCAWIMSWLN